MKRDQLWEPSGKTKTFFVYRFFEFSTQLGGYAVFDAYGGLELSTLPPGIDPLAIVAGVEPGVWDGMFVERSASCADAALKALQSTDMWGITPWTRSRIDQVIATRRSIRSLA